ncbi:glycerophosphodiester phosphodiesterase family protein [Pleionea sediminis]|uniref:glycerophosphodiester phosphodiesterase family protein n=1 Tax=Pleionea sediminis TaxID=2569479 RepID=UPI001184EFFD|nr:glycerophosphodiester phosphodiesterase family protein [Pleionea sediminis]
MKLFLWATIFLVICVTSSAKAQNNSWKKLFDNQLGPRPFFLLNDMDEGPLKSALQQCEDRLFYRKSDFSIGHRGAPMQFPEHTKESYIAAAKMGAGIVECDVTFTQDKELVCRHSQCDLHTTTNILEIPELATKCSEPFSPADPVSGKPASARCCTSDITLNEFKSLCGKMDAANTDAKSVAEYLKGTAKWRTDLYSSCGTVLSHKESIDLFKQLSVKMTPELKAPSVDMPYEGTYSQADYAQQMIDEYREARIPPRQVFPQSFNLDDVKYWIENEPRYAQRAVYLDARMYQDEDFQPSLVDMMRLRDQGVNIIAPPMWALLSVSENNEIVPSSYALLAKQAGLKIITWTLERDGPLASGGGWYHQSISQLINNDGDTYKVLDVLARKVGVIGVFSDWPATTSFYANCMNIR